MTKYELFKKDEARRDALRDALPVVIPALEALKDHLEAGRINEGLASPYVGNAYFQQIVGAKYLIDNLPGMTTPDSRPTAPTPRRQFTEADREELKRKLEQ